MRGKQSQAAANRRAAADTEAQVDALRRTVARLTSERDAALTKADYWQQRHTQDVRTLKAEVEQGTSEELRTAFAAIESMRGQRDSLQIKLDHLKKTRDKEFSWWCSRVKADLGLTGQEAIELGLGMFGDHSFEEMDQFTSPVVYDPPGNRRPKTADSIRRVQAARGDRARPTVTRLQDVVLAWRHGPPADLVGPRRSAGVQQ